MSKSITTAKGTKWTVGDRFKIEVMDNTWEAYRVTDISDTHIFFRDCKGYFDETESEKIEYLDVMGFRK